MALLSILTNITTRDQITFSAPKFLKKIEVFELSLIFYFLTQIDERVKFLILG